MTTLQWLYKELVELDFTVRGNMDPNTKSRPESYITPFCIISVQVSHQGEITQSVSWGSSLLNLLCAFYGKLS